MSFQAECPFCSVLVRHVPEERTGESTSCPRCGNSFTLAPFDASISPTSRAVLPPARTNLRETEPSPKKDKGYWNPKPLNDLPSRRFRDEALAPAEQDGVSVPAKAAVPTPSRSTNGVGLASFLIASLAVPVASIPGAARLSLSVATLGLALGVLGIGWALTKARGLRSPLGGTVVSSIMILVLVLGSGLAEQPGIGEAPATGREPVVVALGANDGTPVRAVQSGWITALSEAYQQDDVRVRITSVSVNQRNGSAEKEKGPTTLAVGVRTVNVGGARRIPYTGWNAAAKDRPLLVDDQTTWCRQLPASAIARKIAPGNSVDELLVFELPRVEARFWRLKLPLSALGGNGDIPFEIPRRSTNERR
jgi:hypothetical protein